MKHSLWHRFLGYAIIGTIAVSYVILVPPTQFYLWIRGRKKDLAWLGYYYFDFLLRFYGIRLKVEGLENVPKDRNFIILSNHQSFIDIGCLINQICPIAFLAKKELFSLPFFGNSLKFMGCVPIDRGNREANAYLPKLLQERINQGYNYVVYPEGTRSQDGKLLQFKNGIFKIIKEAPVPVLPVTIDGNYKIMPKKGLSLYPGKTRLVIHPVIEPGQIEQWSLEEFREGVKAQIQKGLEH